MSNNSINEKVAVADASKNEYARVSGILASTFVLLIMITAVPYTVIGQNPPQPERTLPTAIEGTEYGPFTFRFRGLNAMPPYNWTVDPNTPLPTGLVLDSSSGR